MERKEFNPSDWLPNEEPVQEAHTQEQNNSTDITEIEYIIKEIEEQKLDIAAAYADWRNIGFAFADALGENGRSYFHRISSFYPDYEESECNRQYTKCLNSKGAGITLKTFFYHAKAAGININGNQQQETLPTLPDALYQALPEFLQKVAAIASMPEEKDILLLGSIVALSACFPTLYGIYDGKKVYANLYLFITAQASAGKGRLIHCKQLVMPVHNFYREQAMQAKEAYKEEMAEYNEKKGNNSSSDKPEKPPEKMLIIPANSSTTGVFQLLYDSGGKGLIFETEGDTLSQTFKSDYGNYSDGFRKAFHNETISYYRRTDREYVDIQFPCLSALLSGTPKQIEGLIPNAENGLFSRFMFYFMNVRPVWKDVFSFSSENNLDNYFNNLGNTFFTLFKTLQDNSEIEFCLTADQQRQFNQFFAEVQDQYLSLQGLDYLATIRRLGLIAFRIAMILSTLRLLETSELAHRLVCEERDFKSALTIVKILNAHSAKVFAELPEAVQPVKRKNKKERFLDALPEKFNRKQYLEIAAVMKIAAKTAEGYITEFVKKGLIHRDMNNDYTKCTVQDIKEREEAKE